MLKVTKEEFFAAVRKAAAVNPMPTREYLPIRDSITGDYIGQKTIWETQCGPRVLFGVDETRHNEPDCYFLA